MEATECGAASLSIVLRFHGVYLPLEQLRLDCGVSRDGSSAFNVVEAAKKYGLKGSGYRKDLKGLREIKGPSILFWGFNHFLVLEKVTRKCAYINDPALGHRKLSHKEFQKHYSGIVLCFEKMEGFKKIGKGAAFFKSFSYPLKFVSNTFPFLMLAGVLLLVPGLALPGFLRAFIDTFFTHNLASWDYHFVAMVASVFLFSFLINNISKATLNRVSIYLSMKMSSQFLWHLFHLPLQFYMQRFSGEIAYRQQLNTTVANTLMNSVISSTIDLLLIIGYGALLFLYSPHIAWISVLAAVCNFVVVSIIYKSRLNTYARLQQNSGKMARTGIGGLQQIETIKSRGIESDFFSKWAGTFTHVFNDKQEVEKKDVLLSIVPLFLALLAGAVLLGVGSLEILEERMSVGMLMAMLLLQQNFLHPISRFTGLNETIQNMQVDLDRIEDVLKNPVDQSYSSSPNPIKKRRLKGKLEFRNVSFGYIPVGEPLIDNLSFTIKPGKRLAIVGQTGSGKSTIAKLAMGLLEPWSGEILFDDIPIHKIPRELFYQSLATVDQDLFFFSGTIRDNITLWNSSIPDETVIHATKDASLHDEILKHPHHYDTELLEGAKNLSGGQKQRLEMARALLYNPPLLILDEAMSVLDSKTETAIIERVLVRECSVLMIAHRLSTVRECEEILVIDKGKLLQRGSHEELKKESGMYQELIKCETLEWSQ